VRDVLGAAGVLGVLSLPWAVPAVLAGAVTDPAGVDAFAARADGPYGTVGSLLSLGGIWNAEAGVPAQEVWPTATARLAVCLVAIGAYLWLGRRREVRPGWWGGLLVAAVAGLAVALLGAYLPGVLKTLIGWWAGFGPLRDGQAYIAPLALLQAVGFGVLVARVTDAPGGGAGGIGRRDDAPGAGEGGERSAGGGPGAGQGRAGRPFPPGRSPSARGGWVVAAVALLAPVLVLPGAVWGAWGRLEAVDYPAEWRRAQAVVNGDPAPGALVSLPWGAHRAFGWNGGRVTLDPAVKMFARPVVWNDELLVGLPGGGTLRVRGEDARAREIGALLAGEGPLTAALRARGVRYVLISAANENTFRFRLPGAAVVLAGREITLMRL